MADDNTLKPLAWAWTNLRTESRGAYFKPPEDFGIDTSHPEYSWQTLCSLAAAKARIAELEARVAEMERQPLTETEYCAALRPLSNEFVASASTTNRIVRAIERAHRIGTTDATGDAA